MGAEAEGAPRAGMEETTGIRKALGEAEGTGETAGGRKEKRDRKTRGYFFKLFYFPGKSFHLVSGYISLDKKW